jgi:hypothetical protein
MEGWHIAPNSAIIRSKYYEFIFLPKDLINLKIAVLLGR